MAKAAKNRTIKIDAFSAKLCVSNIKAGFENRTDPKAALLAKSALQCLEAWVFCPLCEGRGCKECDNTGLNIE